ncbi:MAG TPA: response regulator [Candidatus Saccharimonadales bacterium]|nr:response regulator [Candidatus Saccharimonadales bacterium]
MTSPKNKTVLVADDDHFITVAYKAGLEHAGYNVLIAEDGEQAIALIDLHVPDVVLLDIIMPKLNGFEVLQAVKAKAHAAHVPILVLTNLSQPSDQKTALDYGANGVLIKANVSFRDILAHIERLITVS